MHNKIIVFLGKLLNRLFPYHIGLMLREKNFSKEHLQARFTSFPMRDNAYAIVMQGPIIVQNHFTYETLRLYKYVYPNIFIVLSTWRNENVEELDLIRTLGIEIIENDKPVFAGIGNINMQICSTTTGIKRAVENKAAYILKTRTDIRLCKNIDFLYFFTLRTKQFDEYRDPKLQARLVIFNINMFLPRLYSICDLTMFGHTKDMLTYWDVPFDEMTKFDSFTFEELYQTNLGEFYYANNFFKKVNFITEAKESAYFDALIKYFNITDVEELDLFWYKYRYYLEGKSRYGNLDSLTTKGITWSHAQWLLLFENK